MRMLRPDTATGPLTLNPEGVFSGGASVFDTSLPSGPTITPGSLSGLVCSTEVQQSSRRADLIGAGRPFKQRGF